MYTFPDLSKWLDIEEYREHNECRLLEIKMKLGLSKSEIEKFCLEFAKYICFVRCSNEVLYNEMINAIENGIAISETSKIRLQNDFYNGFIRDEKYRSIHDFKASFDEEGIKGYLGEALYYLVRENHVEDENKAIVPWKPKAVSKTSGIDFLEVRKDEKGYYFIVGEVKTTENSYSSRNKEVIDSFLIRINRNFSEIYCDLKNQDDKTDDEYTHFLQTMLDIFYGFKGSDRKRLAGVFNYDYCGKKINSNAFSTWKSQPFEIDNNPVCRRIKLVGIYSIENVLEQVRDILWNVL